MEVKLTERFNEEKCQDQVLVADVKSCVQNLKERVGGAVSYPQSDMFVGGQQYINLGRPLGDPVNNPHRSLERSAAHLGSYWSYHRRGK